MEKENDSEILDFLLKGFDIPQYASQAGYICLNCGYQPLRYLSEGCPSPICNHKSKTDALLSKSVGLILMSLIQADENFTKLLVATDEETRNALRMSLKQNVYSHFMIWFDDVTPRFAKEKTITVKKYGKHRKIDTYEKAVKVEDWHNRSWQKVDIDILSKWIQEEGLIKWDGIDLIDFYIFQLSKLQSNPSFIKSVKVSGLFGYKNYILDFVDNNGEVKKLVSIIGTNGIGKTTILNLLTLLLEKGNLSIDYSIDDQECEKFINLLCDVPFNTIQIELFGGARIILQQAIYHIDELDLSRGCQICCKIEYSPMTLYSGFSVENSKITPVEFLLSVSEDGREREYDIDEVKEHIRLHRKNLMSSGIIFNERQLCYISIDRTNTSLTFVQKCQAALSKKQYSKLEKYLENESAISSQPEILDDFETTWQNILAYRNRLVGLLEPDCLEQGFGIDEEYQKKLKDISNSEYVLTEFGPCDESLRDACIALLNANKTQKSLNYTILPPRIKDAINGVYDFILAYEDYVWAIGELYPYDSKDTLLPTIVDCDKEYASLAFVKKGDHSIIPIEKLSSGEKQLAIIFYNLIFKATQDSILIIDEPEVSLHILWQEVFLKIVGDLVDDRNMQLVIATHSPFITTGKSGTIVEARDYVNKK